MALGGLAFFVINRINSADPNYEPKYLLLFTDAKVRLFFDIAPEKNTKEYEFHINMQIRNDLLRKGKNNSL